MLYTIETQPAVEPISTTDLTEIKNYLRVPSTYTAHDALISSLIIAARRWCENYTRRHFISTKVNQYLDCFPLGSDPIELKANRVIDAADPDFKIEYWDADDAEDTPSKMTKSTSTTVNDYKAEVIQEPGFVFLEPNVNWPVTKTDRRNSVKITYSAGFGTAAGDVPADIRQAIMSMVWCMYYDPGSPMWKHVPGERIMAIRLLDPWKIYLRA